MNFLKRGPANPAGAPGVLAVALVAVILASAAGPAGTARAAGSGAARAAGVAAPAAPAPGVLPAGRQVLLITTSAGLAAAPSTVRFSLDLIRTGPALPLSTRTNTVWTWRSAPHPGARLPTGWSCLPGALGQRACAVEPMMTLSYQVAGMAPDGSASPGRQAIHVTVGHLQLVKPVAITRAAVSVSFDGGRTWHPAYLTGQGGTYTAVFTAPARAKVTLRIRATGAAGNSITETITSAYQIAS